MVTSKSDEIQKDESINRSNNEVDNKSNNEQA